MTQLAASELLVRSEPRGRKRRFIGHFLEMIVVMSLGMAVFGAAFSALHDLLFGGDYAGAWRDHVVLAAFGMAFNMTVPMVLWMRYRGHSWERGGEMAVAMNLPVLPLLALYAFDLLGTRRALLADDADAARDAGGHAPPQGRVHGTARKARALAA